MRKVGGWCFLHFQHLSWHQIIQEVAQSTMLHPLRICATRIVTYTSSSAVHIPPATT